MDIKTLIDNAVPTPFGWVVTTQMQFDLNSMIAFQKQLVSLGRACGKAASVTEIEAPVLAR